MFPHLLAPLTLAWLALVGLTGCQSLLRPAPEERMAAALHGQAHFAGARLHRLERATFMTLANPQPCAPALVPVDGRWQLAGVAAGTISGVATAIRADGYLLTAMHVVQAHTFVIGWVGTRFILTPARVVHTFAAGPFGNEYALLHVAAGPLTALPWASTAPAPHEALYGIAFHRATEFRPLVLAGELQRWIVPPGRADPNLEAQVISTNLPFWQGDSGGALLNAEGEILGVNNAFRLPWWNLRVDRLSALPDPAVVERLIAADRNSRATTPAADAVPDLRAPD